MAVRSTNVFVGTRDGAYKVSLPDGKVSLVGLKGHFINYLHRHKKALFAACPEIAPLHKMLIPSISSTEYPEHVPGLHMLKDEEHGHCLWRGNAKSCAAVETSQGTTRLLVGTEPADVLISDDDGRSWKGTNSFAAVPNRSSWSFPPPPHQPHVLSLDLAQDTKNGTPALLVAGIEVGGVVVSPDLGLTWQHRSQGLCPDVHSVRPDPHHPGRLLSVSGGYPGIPGGLYRSLDAGLTWQMVTQGLESSRYMVGLCINPHCADEVVVTSGMGPPSRGCMIYTSSNGGDSFKEVTNQWLPDPQDLGRQSVPVPLFTRSGLVMGTATGDLLLLRSSSDESSGAAPTAVARLPSPITCMVADEEGSSPSSICH